MAPTEAGMEVHMCNPRAGRAEKGDGGACRLASLAELACF